MVPSSAQAQISNHHSSPVPKTPLDDEDLLEEILLRLPPQPSSLPRASLVCSHWRSILSDPQFLSRFRKHHKKPPLLGFFVGHFGYNPIFTSVLDLPDQIPADRFFVPYSEDWLFMGCRHGLAVLINGNKREVLVWDPLTGRQHRISFPPGINKNGMGSRWACQALVVCADAEDGHVHGDCFLSPFRLVLISGDHKKAFACLYESASGLWGNIISTVTDSVILFMRPGILIGNTVYWLFSAGDILVFNFERQTLGVIKKPAQSDDHLTSWCFQLLRTNEGSGLGFVVLSKLSIHLWESEMNSDGVVGWVPQQKIIELQGMFPWGLPSNDNWVLLAGCDEDATVIVLFTWIGKFMLQLDSMQITKISETNDNRSWSIIHMQISILQAGKLGGNGWIWNCENMRSSNVLCWLNRGAA